MSSKASQRFLLLWSTLAVAGGCQQILGISDYDIDPKLGDNVGGEGGESTTAGTAGKSGIGGKAGFAGDSSEGGAAGNPVVIVGGNGGVAATAGAAGEGGAPPVDKFTGCDGTPFNGNEAILRSCILRVGCLQWLWPTETISRCVSQNSQNLYEGTRCTLDAETCDDITACEGKHLEPTFCGSGATAKVGMWCNGNELVDCDGFVPYARDCTKDGATCKEFSAPVEDMETAGCVLPLPANTCTVTDTAEKCSGTEYLYQCNGTQAYGSHCTSYAAGCRSVDGELGCFYPLNACTSEGVACSNNRATWCDGTSKVTFDCGSVGLGCQTSGDYSEDGERECLAPGCAPEDAAACEESCSGTKLTLCYGGAPLTVDCKDYGFKRCEEYSYECDPDMSINDCQSIDDVVNFAQCE
jgi:hypothetical protein